MSHPKRFVVLALPRTGSNWLCTLLDSHPQILCHHELFNPDGIHYSISHREGQIDLGSVAERDRNPLAMLDRAWRETLGYPVVGFKHNRDQSAEILQALFADRELSIVHMRRRNRVRTVLSEIVAQATGEWESYPGRPLGEPPRITVDADELRRRIAVNEKYETSLTEALAASGQRQLTVTYEELASTAEQRRVLEFLAVDPQIALRGNTRKQGTRDLRQRIVNFEALAVDLRGSELETELFT
jgi:LPS sulfotransferase NodH